MEGAEQLRRLLHVIAAKFAKVIVDGLNLIQVVHSWFSRISVVVETGRNEKAPRCSRASTTGLLKRLLGTSRRSAPERDAIGARRRTNWSRNYL